MYADRPRLGALGSMRELVSRDASKERMGLPFLRLPPRTSFLAALALGISTAFEVLVVALVVVFAGALVLDWVSGAFAVRGMMRVLLMMMEVNELFREKCCGGREGASQEQARSRWWMEGMKKVKEDKWWRIKKYIWVGAWITREVTELG